MSDRPLTVKEAKMMFAVTDEAEANRKDKIRSRIEARIYGAALDPTRCCIRISERPYYIRLHQCRNKARVKIEGYPLCYVHEKKVAS